MSNDEMKRLSEAVRKIVKEENQPIIEKLDATYDQVVYLTEKVNGEVIPTLDLHTKYFKQIAKKFDLQESQNERDEENIFRLDKRLIEVESNQGIQARPELFTIK